MARPRKPTAALELKGAFKKDPQRKTARKNEPRPNGPVGAAPEHFDADERRLWDEFAGYGFWLTDADRLMLEIAVKLMALFRKNALDGGGISKLIGALAKLGFSPTDRSKVQAPGAKEPEADPFADFK
ncbi:terminase [Sinorhizobium meliloti]|nr:terminase [Sinorhizobium meliloti]MDW9523805.1 terminase [Sinorhizobium meliloti]MDW9877473.1 terminase [Sinorhizobium meliloti]